MTVPQHVFLAARTGDITVLREYFASGDRDPNDVAWNGWTLLDGACRGTRDEVAGRDWGGTPRVISCEVVSFLLSQGASVDYQDPDGTWHRPLVIAAYSCSTQHYRDEEEVCAALKLLSRGRRDTLPTAGAGRGPRKPPCARRTLRPFPAASSSSCFLSGSRTATGGGDIRHTRAIDPRDTPPE